MAAIAMDAEMRVRTLIALTEELTAIFARENASLSAGRLEDFQSMQEDKARLAAAFAGSVRNIAADRGALGEAGEPLLEKLKTIAHIFERRAAEQHGLLESEAKSVQRG